MSFECITFVLKFKTRYNVTAKVYKKNETT